MASSSSSIPGFYRVFFTIIDPILSGFGVIMHLSPSAILPNYALTPLMPPSTETRLLLDALAGFFLFLAVLQAILLRARPNDVGVWKILQAATICVDVAMVLAFVRALDNTHRLDTRTWRVEEWSNIGINSAVGLVRAAFVLGIGTRRKGKKM